MAQVHSCSPAAAAGAIFSASSSPAAAAGAIFSTSKNIPSSPGGSIHYGFIELGGLAQSGLDATSLSALAGLLQARCAGPHLDASYAGRTTFLGPSALKE